MSDDFEDSTNIFNASAGDLSADGNQVYATGLERFGNVFVPVKATAKAELTEAQTLTSKDKFRLTFDMFSGWEQNGKENTFSVKDADGNEIVGLQSQAADIILIKCVSEVQTYLPIRKNR